MVSNYRRALAVAVTGFAACLLTACGSQDESPKGTVNPPAAAKPRAAVVPEKRPDIQRGEHGEVRYSGETNKGEAFEAQLGGDVVIPKNFPKDIPLYPNSVPFSAMEIAGRSSIVSLDSEAQPSEIYEFYKDELASSGWKLVNEVNLGGARVLTSTKGDDKAVLTIEGTEKGTRYGFMLGPAG